MGNKSSHSTSKIHATHPKARDTEQPERIQLFPICYVPTDLLKIIIGYLDDSSVIKCAFIAKEWRDAIGFLISAAQSDFVFYHKILHPGLPRIISLTLHQKERECVSNLTLLTNLTDLNVTTVEYSQNFWRNSVAKLTKLESLTVTIDFSEVQTVGFVLKQLTRLKKLRVALYNTESITSSEESSIELSDDYFKGKICKCDLTDPPQNDLAYLLQVLPLLTRLEHLDITIELWKFTASQIDLPTRLTTLKIWADHIDPCLPLHLSTLTNLETLHIFNLGKPTSIYLDRVFKPFVNLKRIELPRLNLTNEIAATKFMQQMQAIKYCTIDKHIDPNLLSNLTYLVVSNPTPATVVQKIAQLRNLRELSLPFGKDQQDTLFALTTLNNLEVLRLYRCDKEVLVELSRKLVNLNLISCASMRGKHTDLAYKHQLLL